MFKFVLILVFITPGMPTNVSRTAMPSMGVCLEEAKSALTQAVQGLPEGTAFTAGCQTINVPTER